MFFGALVNITAIGMINELLQFYEVCNNFPHAVIKNVEVSLLLSEMRTFCALYKQSGTPYN